MRENQEIMEVLGRLSELEKMVKLLIVKISEISSSSKETMEKMEMMQKVVLMPTGTNLEDIHAKALSFMKRAQHGWILDSGASKQVTGAPDEFISYTSYPSTYKETIQTADGTCQPIKGSGTVKCTPSITLSSVLHVPSFPVNLVSLSALVDQMDCRVSFDQEHCLIQDRRTGKEIGIGIRHGGLWYVDGKESGKFLGAALAASMNEDEAKVMLQHCRLGHLLFDTMAKAFPEIMTKTDKRKLVCDACEYGKHTRATYVSRGLRSINPFMLVHSDVWMSPVTSVSGMKYFVTFIDCYSRVTWIYLMKHKTEVLKCFQDFCSLIGNQYDA